MTSQPFRVILPRFENLFRNYYTDQNIRIKFNYGYSGTYAIILNILGLSSTNLKLSRKYMRESPILKLMRNFENNPNNHTWYVYSTLKPGGNDCFGAKYM